MPKKLFGTPEWNKLLQRLQANDPSLTSLALNFNQIGDSGPKDLSLALKDNRNLTSLELRINKIGDSGAKDFSLALKDNRTLTSLDLRNNIIGDSGAKALSLALKDNRTLTSLVLGGNNQISASEQLFIDQQITHNGQLRAALHQAAQQGNLALVKEHVAMGVSLLSTTGDAKNTPLHWAVLKSHPPVVEWLLAEMQRQGTTTVLRNDHDKTASDLALNTPLATLFQPALPLPPPVPFSSGKQEEKTSSISVLSSTPLVAPATPPKTTPLPDHLTVIPYQELKVDDESIGQGGFAEVFKAGWQGIPVAFKQLYLKNLNDSLNQEFQKEVFIMARLRHPHVVQLFGVTLQPGHYGLVMEYLPKGSLYGVLQQEKTLAWQPYRWRLASGMSKGVAYLHSQGIVHQDLKSANILVDKEYQAKVTDFGLSRIRLETTTSASVSQNKGKGSLRWRAPETFARDYKPNFASDVYSLGMVLWEIASGKLPFSEESDDTVVMGWIKDKETEAPPTDCPEPYSKLMQSCWLHPATERPSAAELVTQLEKSMPSAPLPKTKSWYFASTVKANAPRRTDGFELLSAEAEDVAKVMQQYEVRPMPGMAIAKVDVIYNSALNEGFAAQLNLLNKRHGKVAFKPKWPQESEAPEYKKQRQSTQALAEQLAAPHQDPDYPHVSIIPAWHGTKKSVVPSLLETGYANLATTDSGFFGKGIYSAYEAEYSYRVYSKDGIIILNYVAFYSAYPTIDGDMLKLQTKGSYQNYDAHFVPVVPHNPQNPNEANYYPCKPGQLPVYKEIVVFNATQCLPRYLVTLQHALPAPVSNLPLLANVQTTQQAQQVPSKQATAFSQNPQTLFAVKKTIPLAEQVSSPAPDPTNYHP